MATRVETETTIGQVVPSLVKDVSQRRIDVYSGVKPHSIHSDEAWARQKGFRTCLAQGMMSTAYVSQMMVTLLGPDFAREIGRASCRESASSWVVGRGVYRASA